MPQSISQKPTHQGVIVSLGLLTVMIFVMVVIGGVTRLTGSGLSIVEWQPVVGILPPLNEGQWLAEFQKYKASPEFKNINFDMTLQGFQSIYWLEYIHRLWGRGMGIVLLVPTVMCFVRPSLKSIRTRMALLWVLGGLQGVMGWYMVKSGLVSDPHVSPYRLAAHLLLGFGIFGVSLDTTLKLLPRQSLTGYSAQAVRALKHQGMIVMGCVLVTVVMGAFVAGHKAGLIYNSFPLMGEGIVPSELGFYTPWWKDLTENPATIQFIHRVLATLTAGIATLYVLTSLSKPLPSALKTGLMLTGFVVLTQYALGILTLLLQVPVHLGATHQGVALLLFGAVLYVIASARRMRPHN